VPSEPSGPWRMQLEGAAYATAAVGGPTAPSVLAGEAKEGRPQPSSRSVYAGACRAQQRVLQFGVLRFDALGAGLEAERPWPTGRARQGTFDRPGYLHTPRRITSHEQPGQTGLSPPSVHPACLRSIAPAPFVRSASGRLGKTTLRRWPSTRVGPPACRILPRGSRRSATRRRLL